MNSIIRFIAEVSASGLSRVIAGSVSQAINKWHENNIEWGTIGGGWCNQTREFPWLPMFRLFDRNNLLPG